jgi:hypothetical protein
MAVNTSPKWRGLLDQPLRMALVNLIGAGDHVDHGAQRPDNFSIVPSSMPYARVSTNESISCVVRCNRRNLEGPLNRAADVLTAEREQHRRRAAAPSRISCAPC